MRRWMVTAAALLVPACAFEGAGTSGQADPAGEEPASVSVSGHIVDFVSGAPVEGATLTTMTYVGGDLSVDGDHFELSGVRQHVAFHLLVAAPGHRNTVSPPIAVGESDVSDVEIAVVPDAFVTAAQTESGLSPSGGIAIASLAADDGTALAGVSRQAFGDVAEDVVFADAAGDPDAALDQSSESGVAVLVNVSPGLIELESADAALHFSADAARVESDAVTVIDVVVGQPPEVPTSVSFSADVLPIFERRGCNGCHQGSGDGRKIGEFSLNPPLDKQYMAVSQRIDTGDPEASLILRKPSFEDPPDGHDVVFTSHEDADYLLLLGWIREGARDN